MSNIDFINQEKRVIKIKPIKTVYEQQLLPEEDERDKARHELEAYKKELQNLEAEQAKRLQETKSLIEQEKDMWQQEKQALSKQAKEVGYSEGFAVGKQEGRAEYEQLLTKVNGMMDIANQDYQMTVEKSEETILELAIHVAEKILKDRLKEEPKTFLPIVLNAIETIKDQSMVSIYLHPHNYEEVIQQKDELIRSLDGDTKVSIYIDHKLEENACVIEHPFGQIDASIDTQLKQLRKALLEVVTEDKQ